MGNAKAVLFYAVIAVFVATAAVTLFGVTGWISVKDSYLDVLFGSLIVELCVAVVGLFKATDWFGGRSQKEAIKLIGGHWWQLGVTEDTNAIGFVHITYSADREQFAFEGDAYTATGDRYARFWTAAAVWDGGERLLRYFWEGRNPHGAGRQTGIGTVRFRAVTEEGVAERGTGSFTRGDLETAYVKDRRMVDYHRASGAEVRTMRSGDKQAVKQLVAETYERLAH